MSAKPAKEQVILALKSRKTLFITIFISWFIYIQLVEKRLNKKGLIYKFWRRKNIKIGKYYTYSLAVARKYNLNVFKKVSILTLTIVILTGVLKRSLVFDSLQKCRINDVSLQELHCNSWNDRSKVRKIFALCLLFIWDILSFKADSFQAAFLTKWCIDLIWHQLSINQF